MDQQATPPAGWRGGGATRLEAFVDAAFAFAVTLLVISADRVPDSVRALVLALKQVPAFAAGFALLALFWYAHVRWSRHYRLDGMLATLLSLLLVFLVLVYVYPLRLLLGTFFAWITAGWLPMPLSDVAGAPQIAFVFVFYGLAFASMSACMGGLYLLAWRRRRQLALDADRAADAIADLVPCHLIADGRDRSGDLVSGHDRVGGPAPLIAGGMDVGVADPGAGGHEVDLAGAHTTDDAAGVAVLDLALEEPGDGLQTGVRVGRDVHAAGAVGGDLLRAVVVDEAPRADEGALPVRQGPADGDRAQPAERHLAPAEDLGRAHVPHLGQR